MMKITQPSASCGNPSAREGLMLERIPVSVTRPALAIIAIGIVAKNNATRTQVRFSKKYP